MLKIFAGFALAIVAILALKALNKNSDRRNIRARLEQICEGNVACNKALNSYLDPCFDQVYRRSGRVRSTGLNIGAIILCINSQAGESIIVVDQREW